MMQYDVIENKGVLAPSRREAIIDPMVGANHNDNNPAHGKTFDASKTGADQTRGLISTLAAHYSLGKALHISETLFSKDGSTRNVFHTTTITRVPACSNIFTSDWLIVIC